MVRCVGRRGAAMTVTERIEIDPGVMMGKPVIRGTRITVELILRKLAEGATEADLFDAYPKLTREDIRAAIGYAADTLAHESCDFNVVRAARGWVRRPCCRRSESSRRRCSGHRTRDCRGPDLADGR